MRKVISITIFTICLLCIFAIIFFSKNIATGIENGLNLSFYIVIPSMFIFMVFANIIASSALSFYLSFPFSFIGKYVFKLDCSLFSIFIISIIGGYPVSSKIIADKIKKGEISIQTGEYMLNFCVNCSPSFLVSSVSIMLFSTPIYGIIIYCSQIFSCMIIALISGVKLPIQTPLKQGDTSTKKDLDLPALFVTSVNSATQSMIVICSFIVLFCGLFVFIDLIPIHDSIKIYVKGLLEVTSGCQLVDSSNIFESVLQVSLFTSFGGVCVILQIMALINGSDMRISRFIKTRFIYTALACIFTFVSLKILNPISSCVNQYQENIPSQIYSVSPLSTFFFIFLAIMIIILLLSNKYSDLE